MEKTVWIKHRDIFKKGTILEKNENTFKIKHDENNILELPYSEIWKYNGDHIDNTDNLIHIPHLNEPSILNGIRLRFQENNIYTWTGDILISINPFQELGLYPLNQQIPGPHIYRIADKAYSKLPNNQTILISGESGAGKTHATREIMKYIENGQENRMVSYTNPVLEAFGNAKTSRNNNSSRFGKFIKMMFSTQQHGQKILSGAQIDTYLLEKVRVVHQNDNERNFHIFYQFLSHEISDKYLDRKAKYKILNGDFLENDTSDFLHTLNSLKMLGFTDFETDYIFRMISAILLLGNLNLELSNELTDIQQLIGIDISRLLFYRTLKVKEEEYDISLEFNERENIRNSLCMKLYYDLFQLINIKINEVLDCHKGPFIGILDIFGFESFKTNRFEQLCINFTNESLQGLFNKYVFQKEFEEYSREGIEYEHIIFPDNKHILNTIAGKYGLLNMLNEECFIPNGNSKNFTQRFLKQHSENKHIKINKKYINTKFSISHYAGWTEYTTDLFMEKNMDKISDDIFIALNQTPRDQKKTVGVVFRSQLRDLMDVISHTNPYFIRCIKPNDQNLQNIFDDIRVNQQLKYSGVLEAVRVARNGYPIRLEHDTFNWRYYFLEEWSREFQPLDYQIGKTKIFLKNFVYERLEDLRNQHVYSQVSEIQKNIRRKIQQRKYNTIRKKIIILQSIFRMKQGQKIASDIKQYKSAVFIQTIFRTYSTRQIYLRTITFIIRIQKWLKNIISTIRHRNAIKIQKYIRRFLCRSKYIYLKKSVRTISIFYLKYLKPYIKNIDRLQNELQGQQNEIKRLQMIEKKYLQQTVDRYNEKHTKTPLVEIPLETNNEITKKIEKKHIQELEKYDVKIQQLLQRENDQLKQISELEKYKENMKRAISEKMQLAQKMEQLERDNHKIRIAYARKHFQTDNCIIF
jgi:myosin V